jgi:hypothetical protein
MFGSLAATSIGFEIIVLAQLTVTPGPGGVPIAPGTASSGFPPGGAGLGGVQIAPGPAARDVPVYQIGPGGIPVLVMPEPRHGRKKDWIVRRYPGCWPCLPQSLVLTIHSHEDAPAKTPSPDAPINSIRDLFTALRACWEPPPRDQAQEGMEMTVRFSFRRSGEIISPLSVTYTKPGTKADVKQVYRRAIDKALDRCGRLPFSEAFKKAIPGRPISIRYVDDRSIDTGQQP